MLCCQTNSLKRWWNLRFLREKVSIPILMIRYALQKNLTHAVNSPFALKFSLTSAVVRSFGVVTCSILVIRVCGKAFVSVWTKTKVDWHFKCKVCVNVTRLGAGNYGRKIDFLSSQQGGHRPALWLTITVRMCITVSDTRPGKC